MRQPDYIFKSKPLSPGRVKRMEVFIDPPRKRTIIIRKTYKFLAFPYVVYIKRFCPGQARLIVDQYRTFLRPFGGFETLSNEYMDNIQIFGSKVAVGLDTPLYELGLPHATGNGMYCMPYDRTRGDGITEFWNTDFTSYVNSIKLVEDFTCGTINGEAYYHNLVLVSLPSVTRVHYASTWTGME